jgi:hypothetical protein
VKDLNPWQAGNRLLLSVDVGPGATAAWRWTTPPISPWRVYISQRHLECAGQEFQGDPLRFQIIVIPKTLADKKVELENRIKELIAEGVQQLEQKVMEIITGWLQKQINVPNCNPGLPLIIF